MAPRLESVTVERVKFVRVREQEVLAVFVAAAGGVQNRLVQTDHDYSQDELDRMAAYLNDSLSGHTLEEARLWIEEQLKEDRANYDRYMRAALMLGGAVTRTAGQAEQPDGLDRVGEFRPAAIGLQRDRRILCQRFDAARKPRRRGPGQDGLRSCDSAGRLHCAGAVARARALNSLSCSPLPCS